MPRKYETTLTPEERVMRARMAAHTLHAAHDSTELTKAATRANRDRFETQVDPNNELEPDERARRAEQARRAYMTQLAYASARARRGQERPPRKEILRQMEAEATRLRILHAMEAEPARWWYGDEISDVLGDVSQHAVLAHLRVLVQRELVERSSLWAQFRVARDEPAETRSG
jgi:DNA-binding transcriptional ArsR family regulator